MRTADMIKSKFWRAKDVEGVRPVVLTISDVTEELVGGRGSHKEAKCFLWFNENAKGLQLNKTRVAIIEAAYGPNSEGWVGQRVRLSFDSTVEFGGRLVGGIKVTTPAGIVWQGPVAAEGAWGDAPQSHPGRPPAPVWDEKRQTWVVPQPVAPIATPAPSNRPPPPVWDGTQWVFQTKPAESFDTQTGEIHDPQGGRPLTISERVGPRPTTTGAASVDPEFDDDIPF